MTDTAPKSTINECTRYLNLLDNKTLLRSENRIKDRKIVSSPFNSNYYLNDASDILPVLALQPNPDDNLLIHYENDLPNGHDNILDSRDIHRFQKYFEDFGVDNLRCNEFTLSWNKGLQFYKDLATSNNLNFSSFSDKLIKFNPFYELGDEYKFSKVFLEGISSMDRKAMTVQQQEINFYNIKMRPVRAELPKLLEQMLVSAVINASPNNGEVIYTTRTLNPVHNEFMVQFALETLEVKHKIQVEIDTSCIEVLKKSFKDEFEFENSVQLGCLVVPTLFKNWGPRYICKLKRVSNHAAGFADMDMRNMGLLTDGTFEGKFLDASPPNDFDTDD